MEKFEFMSPAWIEMARELIIAAMADKDLKGVHYTLCEEFTNPPEHLHRPGYETIGFYVRLADDQLEVGDHPIDDADFRIVSEYQDALMVARDPNAPAADPSELEKRLAAGRLKMIGNPMAAPRALQEVNIHKMLAPRTA